MKKHWKYYVQPFNGRKVLETTFEEYTRQEFVEFLAKWNRMSSSKFWEFIQNV